MRNELENFFKKPFEVLLEELNAFTLETSLQTPGLSIPAKVYFNLAKEGWKEKDYGYQEAKRDETEYLSGGWFGI